MYETDKIESSCVHFSVRLREGMKKNLLAPFEWTFGSLSRVKQTASMELSAVILTQIQIG